MTDSRGPLSSDERIRELREQLVKVKADIQQSFDDQKSAKEAQELTGGIKNILGDEGVAPRSAIQEAKDIERRANEERELLANREELQKRQGEILLELRELGAAPVAAASASVVSPPAARVEITPSDSNPLLAEAVKAPSAEPEVTVDAPEAARATAVDVELPKDEGVAPPAAADDDADLQARLDALKVPTDEPHSDLKFPSTPTHDPAAAPVTPPPATPPATPPAADPATPPADPKKAAAEAAEKERRAHEAEQLLNMKIARATWYRDSFMQGKEFAASPRGELDPKSMGGADTGITWKTDVNIEPGRYFPVPPDDLNTSLKVDENGTVRLFTSANLSPAQKSAAIGNAIDFFGSKGETSITLNFDNPGPYSLPIVFQTMAKAANRGMEVKLGDGIADYMASLTDEDIKALPKEVKADLNKLLKAHDTPFKQWLQDNGLDKKGMFGGQVITAQQIKYLGEYLQDRSAESAKKISDITVTKGDKMERPNVDAYKHAYQIDKSKEALESNAKLKEYKDANKDAVAQNYKEQMFGSDHDGKSVGDRVTAVTSEMDSLEKRRADLAERIEKQDNEMQKMVDKHLESRDPNILTALHDRLQLVEVSRNSLIQEMQEQKADLDKRYDVCKTEAGKLATDAGATPEDKAAASKLEAKADNYLNSASADKDSSKGMQSNLNSVDENKGFLSKDFVKTTRREVVETQRAETDKKIGR